MEASRSSKRRKTDPTVKTPTARQSRIPSPPNPAPDTSTTPQKASSTRHNVADGKERAGLSQKGTIDVYDDFDGAHVGASQLKQPRPDHTASSPWNGTKPRQTRHQGVTKGILQASKNSSGFFKKFRRAQGSREESSAQHTTLGSLNTSQSPELPMDHMDGSAGGQEDINSRNSSKRHHEGALRPLDQKNQPKQAGWSYDRGGRKTLEDEMRDVARAAQEEAEAGAVTSPQNRRSQRANIAASNERKGRRQVQEVQSREYPPSRPSLLGLASNSDHKEFHELDFFPRSAPEKEVVQDMTVLNLPTENQPHGAPLLEQSLSAGCRSAAMRERTEEGTQPMQLRQFGFRSQDLLLIQSIVLERLTGKRWTPLVGLDEEYSKVSTLISQTVSAGESNSILVAGSRGSGKSALVERILNEQRDRGSFHVVKLNGLIHTDDKIALREIWRQLGRETGFNQEPSAMKSYADTLTSLLALLSHSVEQGQSESQETTKSVIFVLDEFEMFATHPRQTLLYNLFDVAQSRKAPIAVVGLTKRIDISDSLEKRVKSRFSHRHVHLRLATSWPQFKAACQSALMLCANELHPHEKKRLGMDLSDVVDAAVTSPARAWNQLIADVFLNDRLAGDVRRIYSTSKSVPDFHCSMLLSLLDIPVTADGASPTSSATLLAHLTSAFPSLARPDSKLALLPALSTLHLALLISAARLTAIYGVEVVPFEQAFEEYKALASKAKVQASSSGLSAQGGGGGPKLWCKDVARAAWAELIQMDILVEEGSRGARVDIGLEEIGACGQGSLSLGGWDRWCKEI